MAGILCSTSSCESINCSGRCWVALFDDDDAVVGDPPVGAASEWCDSGSAGDDEDELLRRLRNGECCCRLCRVVRIEVVVVGGPATK